MICATMHLAESWAAGTGCVRRGLAITRTGIRTHLGIMVVFVIPALAAAYLAASTVRRQPTLGEQLGLAVLPWVTAVIGSVVVMVAVSRQARERPVGVVGATLRALPWVPRYLWTNVHTTIIFWVPNVALLQARALQEGVAPVDEALQPIVGGLWWVLSALLGLYLHTRTLLAPFLAVHGDLPGTMAALEAWRLSGARFGRCLATLIAGAAPVALPLAAIAGGVELSLSGVAREEFWAAAPNLVWAGIQVVRPVLIPATYILYRDLWSQELVRRDRDGQPPIPILARVLLRLTRPLPHLGRYSPL